MKLKYTEIPGISYLKTKINSTQDKLGFFLSTDNSLLFEWEIGEDKDISLEEAEKLDNRCVTLCGTENGHKYVDVTDAYKEVSEEEYQAIMSPLTILPPNKLITEF